ncbi:MAG: galactonate dehydratase [Gammaproteobacteria bacterium]|nr:galactonate dehydratase [Gammaproteobacteria bacterium]
MQITSVKAFPAGVPFSPTVTRNFVFVRIETDEGITGWSEATSGPLAVATMVEEFGRELVGKDPGEIEKHWQTLYHHFHVRGGVVQMTAISGIEIALWDIKGQVLGAPVYELLGGRVRDRIWTYGRWDGPTPGASVENAMNHVERGLTALKGDPFDHRGIFIDRASEDLAIEKLKAVREAVGDDVELLVEVHGRLAPSDAVRVGNRMEEFRPFYFEEPVPPQNLHALKKVSDKVNIPISTGERLLTKFDFAELLPLHAVDLIQPDIMYAGGILETKKIAAMAEAYYVGFQPHNCYGPLSTLAALHVDACTPNFIIQEGGIHPWLPDAVVGDFPVQKDGYFGLPPGPGLGAAMDEQWLAAHPWDNNARTWAHRKGNNPSRQDIEWS